MARFDAEIWSGVLGTAICAAVGVPVVVLVAQGSEVTVGPPALWFVVFGGFLAALVTGTWFEGGLHRTRARAIFGVQVVLGAAAVLLAPRAGFLPIVLVFTSAFSCYVLTRRETIGVVALNTAVVGVAVATGPAGLLEVLLSAGLYLLLQSASVLSVLAFQREERSRRELAEAHVELRAATALLEESSRAAERLRISRDLHDLLGHQLTALTLELEVASHHSTPPAREHVTRASRIARELLADVRTTVGELRRRTPDLTAALEALVADLHEPTVHLSVESPPTLDDETTTILLRCAQEVVTNAIRHAEATHLWIEVGQDDQGSTLLTAWDDGLGAHPIRLGHGLRGLTERIEGLGGRVVFTGDQGFRVSAVVPAA
ncbi:sensor histidine kinase [Actinotalea sp. C106]|uniref:sensor histidine kinase n=1 Tax=Actinotalea sp. C106 TaxID=2908644 RepID=UPI00202974C1|nr:sensor histidine kinase [Actinotalea sp. C106]